MKVIGLKKKINQNKKLNLVKFFWRRKKFEARKFLKSSQKPLEPLIPPGS